MADQTTVRIPITMCHGVNRAPVTAPGVGTLTREHFRRQIATVRELGFESISYDDLAAWRAGTGRLAERPIMLDFDHPVVTMIDAREVLDEFGYRGNLFVNTGGLDEMYREPIKPLGERQLLTWEELGALRDHGWHIGAHTVTHPNLSKLALEDPTGERVRAELDQNNATLRERLGVEPRDFAFTGTSWSSAAEAAVRERYRFGRLWIVGSEYQVDGRPTRYADLVGVPGPDEADGGPPMAARYATPDSDPHRLPSVDLQRLIYDLGAFRRYLLGALE
jgi:peptidoglycan/xylan/chitin deacetylase (PgdA/CDA1 family)